MAWASTLARAHECGTCRGRECLHERHDRVGFLEHLRRYKREHFEFISGADCGTVAGLFAEFVAARLFDRGWRSVFHAFVIFAASANRQAAVGIAHAGRVVQQIFVAVRSSRAQIVKPSICAIWERS